LSRGESKFSRKSKMKHFFNPHIKRKTKSTFKWHNTSENLNWLTRGHKCFISSTYPQCNSQFKLFLLLKRTKTMQICPISCWLRFPGKSSVSLSQNLLIYCH
jgi:hypothetical protein